MKPERALHQDVLDELRDEPSLDENELKVDPDQALEQSVEHELVIAP